MNKIQYVIFLLFCMLACLSGSIQADKKKEEKKKGRIIGAPLVYYTPETKMAFGLAGSYLFRLSKKDKEIRPSTISPLLIYTLNKQFKAQVKTDLFFRNNNYRLVSMFNIQRYPDKFFGIGINSKEDNEESFSSDSILFTLSLQKKILSGLNIGVEYKYMKWTMLEIKPGGLLESGVPGNDGGKVSGLGFFFSYDTRDNIFASHSGSLVELKAKTFNGFLGSDHKYTDISLDVRQFLPVFSSHVLAFQAKITTQNGEVPFNSLAHFGGEFNMRGYYSGRFRDKNMMVFQAEYRRPLFWRISAAGFVGLGTVAEKFRNLDLGNMKFSYGAGLRIQLDKKENIQLRIDFGIGEDGTGFYFSIFEAF